MLECEKLEGVGQEAVSNQQSAFSPEPRIFTAKDAEVAKENRKAFSE